MGLVFIADRNTCRNRGILYIPPLLRYGVLRLLRNCYATRKLRLQVKAWRNTRTTGCYGRGAKLSENPEIPYKEVQ